VIPKIDKKTYSFREAKSIVYIAQEISTAVKDKWKFSAFTIYQCHTEKLKHASHKNGQVSKSDFCRRCSFPIDSQVFRLNDIDLMTL
jgi:hypothetical protein